MVEQRVKAVVIDPEALFPEYRDPEFKRMVDVYVAILNEEQEVLLRRKNAGLSTHGVLVLLVDNNSEQERWQQEINTCTQFPEKVAVAAYTGTIEIPLPLLIYHTAMHSGHVQRDEDLIWEAITDFINAE